MIKFYRLEARRILAGPKKMSTTVVTRCGETVPSRPRKRLTALKMARMGEGQEVWRDAVVEKLRMGVDNGE
jgi:hypothetical protein